ncbi:MAG: SPOR domain-containing protein [Xanthomonadales bacterium]|nr:SPOR domain-containing protein [Xanthomonadales bacterium]
MAAARRKTGRQAVRDQDVGAVPGWVWMLLGMAMGGALAVFLMTAGIFRSQPPRDLPQPRVETQGDEGELAELAQPESPETDYDFYTVLPEMEVVIPDQEIEQRVQRRESEREGPYVLQVGSFRNPDDAERTKAELAFLGIVAQVASVEVNQATWHRVRVGPIESVREMDALKRRLQDGGFQVLVLKER